MEWGYLIRLPKNTYKYILLYPAHMFLTVGMTLGIRVPVVGPLKDINFQKHSGAPLAVLVYLSCFKHYPSGIRHVVHVLSLSLYPATLAACARALVKRRDHHEVTRKYDDLSNKNGISC
jgi:uncharacterized membrane protein YoaT (DUF817 family)